MVETAQEKLNRLIRQRQRNQSLPEGFQTGSDRLVSRGSSRRRGGNSQQSTSSQSYQSSLLQQSFSSEADLRAAEQTYLAQQQSLQQQAKESEQARQSRIRRGRIAGQLMPNTPERLDIQRTPSKLTFKEQAIKNKRDAARFSEGYLGTPIGSKPQIESKTFNLFGKHINYKGLGSGNTIYSRPDTIKQQRAKSEDAFLIEEFNKEGKPGYIETGGMSTTEGQEIRYFEPSDDLIAESKKRSSSIKATPEVLGSTFASYAQGGVNVVEKETSSAKGLLTIGATFGAGKAVGFGSKVAKAALVQKYGTKAGSIAGKAGILGLGAVGAYSTKQVFTSVKNAPTEQAQAEIITRTGGQALLFGSGLKSGIKSANKPFSVKLDSPESVRFAGEVTNINSKGVTSGIAKIVSVRPTGTATTTRADLFASRLTGKNPNMKITTDLGIRTGTQRFKVKGVDEDLTQGNSDLASRRGKGGGSLTKLSSQNEVVKEFKLPKNLQDQGFKAFKSVGVQKEGIQLGNLRIKSASSKSVRATTIPKDSPFVSKSLTQDVGKLAGRESTFIKSFISSKKSVSSFGAKRYSGDIKGVIAKDVPGSSNLGTSSGNILKLSRPLSSKQVARVSSALSNVQTKSLTKVSRPTTTGKLTSSTSQVQTRAASAFAGLGLYEKTTNSGGLLSVTRRSTQDFFTPNSFSKAKLDSGIINLGMTKDTTIIIPKPITLSSSSSRSRQEQTPVQVVTQPQQQTSEQVFSPPPRNPVTTVITLPRSPTPRSRLAGFSRGRIPQLKGTSFRATQKGRGISGYTPSLTGSVRFNVLGKSAASRKKPISGLPGIRPVILSGNLLKRSKKKKRKRLLS